MRRFSILGIAFGLTCFVAGALAAGSQMKADPVKYDPGKTGIVVAAWQAKAGLVDAGNSNHGLVLQKNGPTPTDAAAFAVVTGAEGQTPASGPTWGWDYKTGTYCGAGAPRFNVVTDDDIFHFLGGCTNSTQTPTPGAPGWTRVRIDPTNATQAFPPIAPTAKIVAVAVAFDEQGQGLIDNIVVNGNAAIGKPGNN